MADDQVDLTPEEIPGARFIDEEIENLDVVHLKFWFKCLRINQNGYKKELLERLVYIIQLHAINQQFMLPLFFFFSTTSLHSGLI